MKTKPRNNNVKFENWKSGRYIVKRTEKGAFVTYRKQKGSGIKSRSQAQEIYNLTGTFRSDVVRVNKKRVKLEKNVQQKIYSKTMIGKNTSIIRTNLPIKSEKYYQHVAIIYWYKRGTKRQKSIGYSDIRGTKEDAIKRAVWNAIRDKIITYTWSVNFETNQAFPPDSNSKPIRIELKHEVATYVKSEGKWKK
jgi:hypothetical protein